MRDERIYFVTFSKYTGAPRVLSKKRFWAIFGVMILAIIALLGLYYIYIPSLFTPWLFILILIIFPFQAVVFSYGRKAAQEYRWRKEAENRQR